MTGRWPCCGIWHLLSPFSGEMRLLERTKYFMAMLMSIKSSRIIYRAYGVYSKPLEDLCDALGIDIPPVPDVSLAGITRDSVLLYWKPPENHCSTVRHFVQVNGINGMYLSLSSKRARLRTSVSMLTHSC